MSDTDYANHTQRSNGVQSGVASSALHNKLYRQVSMMSKALADFIASQAFDAKDEDSQLLSQNLQKALTKFAKTPLDDHNTNPAAHAAGIAGNAATATADQHGCPIYSRIRRRTHIFKCGYVSCMERNYGSRSIYYRRILF